MRVTRTEEIICYPISSCFSSHLSSFSATSSLYFRSLLLFLIFLLLRLPLQLVFLTVRPKKLALCQQGIHFRNKHSKTLHSSGSSASPVCSDKASIQIAAEFALYPPTQSEPQSRVTRRRIITKTTAWCYKFVYRLFNFCGYLAHVSLTAHISFTGANSSRDVTRKGCSRPERHGKNTKIDKNKQIQHWSYKDRKHFIISTKIYCHFMIIIRHLFYVTNSMTFRQTFSMTR